VRIRVLVCLEFSLLVVTHASTGGPTSYIAIVEGNGTTSCGIFTLSFSYPIQVTGMVGMKIQGCTDWFFGNALWFNQAAFTLTIMYAVDFVLFFLDTFLWYIICTYFSIG
jgi:1,3-beta-glucan synthase